MLKMRLEQMQAFECAAASRFEGQMVAHLNEFFPKQYERLGETRTREVIREGIRRSRSYGIIAERHVCQYIDIMFAVGDDFDTDRDMPWASRILNDGDLPPGVKVERLRDEAIAHLRSSDMDMQPRENLQ